MRTVLQWLLYFALWPACLVGVTAMSNLVFGTHQSLWFAGAVGTLVGFGMIFMLENERRGWLKGLMWDPDAKEKLAQRRKELAEERERIIAEAKAKAKQTA